MTLKTKWGMQLKNDIVHVNGFYYKDTLSCMIVIVLMRMDYGNGF